MSSPQASRERALPALHERDAEVRAMRALVAGTVAGQPGLLVLEGPAGIGKSRLLAELRRDAATAGARVLSARGSELERGFPYGVVRQLFEATVHALGGPEALTGTAAGAAAILEPAGDDGAADVSFAALHALYWLALDLAESPLVLAVDDLHWCDRPSLRFLAYLARRIDDLPLLVAATLRPREPGADIALLAELVHDPLATVLHPGALGHAAITALLAERFGAEPDPAFAAACERATGGNPLLLQEVLRALESEGVEPRAAQAGMVGVLGPQAVRRAVFVRLARLPGEAVAVARALAVLGDGAEFARVAELAGQPEATTARAMDALAGAEIARHDPPLGFVHPLLGEAVYGDIPPGERRQLHERAVDVLAAAGAPGERIAAQLLRIGGRGDARRVALLADAARSAVARGAADAAIGYLDRALAEPAGDVERPRLLRQLGSLQATTDARAAVEHLGAALGLATDSTERLAIAAALAPVLVFLDRPAEALAVCRAVEADCTEPAQRRWLAATRLGAHVWDDALGDVASVRVAVEEHGDADDVAGHSVLGIAAFYAAMRLDPFEECRELARRALAGDVLLGSPEGRVAFLAAYVVLVAADDDEALRVGEAIFDAAFRGGSLFASFTAHMRLAQALRQRGDLVEAERLIRAGLADAVVWGGDAGRLYAVVALVATLLMRGAVAEARQVWDAGAITAGRRGSYDDLVMATALLQLQLAEGDHAAVLETAASRLEPFAHLTLNVAWFPWRSSWALSLAAVGRPAEACAAADEEVELARRWPAPTALGRALRVRGELAGAEGLLDLEESRRVLEDSPARLELARSLAGIGRALREAGQVADAREPLRRALELATLCGAAGLVEAVRGEIHATGARPRAVALSGPQALTPSERRVATLAAEGTANREIAQALYVTPKTVEVHLTNVYRKLGIKNRRNLAHALGVAAD